MRYAYACRPPCLSVVGLRSSLPPWPATMSPREGSPGSLSGGSPVPAAGRALSAAPAGPPGPADSALAADGGDASDLDQWVARQTATLNY